MPALRSDGRRRAAGRRAHARGRGRRWSTRPATAASPRSAAPPRRSSGSRPVTADPPRRSHKSTPARPCGRAAGAPARPSPRCRHRPPFSSAFCAALRLSPARASRKSRASSRDFGWHRRRLLALRFFGSASRIRCRHVGTSAQRRGVVCRASSAIRDRSRSLAAHLHRRTRRLAAYALTPLGSCPPRPRGRCEASARPGCRARSRNRYGPPPRPWSAGGPARRALRDSASDKARRARTGRA